MNTINTVYSLFKRSTETWPARPLLCVLPETAGIYRIDSGELTYQTVMLEVQEMQKALQAKGFQQGQRVMLLLENQPAFFVYWLAMNQLGISVVPINPELQRAEMAYLIAHAEPILAICVASHIALMQAAAEQANYELDIITPWSELPPARHCGRVTTYDSDPAENEAALIYTSGTTARPKGCVLSNNYFLMAGDWYANAGGLCTLQHHGERMLTPLPLFHMNAMAYSFMAMLSVGGCLICLDRFHPRSWWQSVSSAQASCLHYLGIMPSILMAAAPSATDQCHQVRFGFGAGIDPSLQQAFEQRFGFPLVEAWAMTETGAGAVIAANQEPRQVGRGNIGKPADSIEIKIVDDNNQPVAADRPGELLVRRAGDSPRLGFFTEYYKDPAATAEAWRDGWFHTGDLVQQNAQGEMVFVDRKKNLIRRSGENIAAVEVEAALLQHPCINAAGVTSVADKLRGEEVFACLVVNTTPGKQLAFDIVNWCLQQLAYFKAPAYIAFVEKLPLTATQKIQRGQLKQLAAELLTKSGTIHTAAAKKRQRV